MIKLLFPKVSTASCSPSCFEMPAARAPQHEGMSALTLRSKRSARLEGRGRYAVARLSFETAATQPPQDEAQKGEAA